MDERVQVDHFVGLLHPHASRMERSTTAFGMDERRRIQLEGEISMPILKLIIHALMREVHREHNRTTREGERVVHFELVERGVDLPWVQDRTPYCELISHQLRQVGYTVECDKFTLIIRWMRTNAVQQEKHTETSHTTSQDATSFIQAIKERRAHGKLTLHEARKVVAETSSCTSP